MVYIAIVMVHIMLYSWFYHSYIHHKPSTKWTMRQATILFAPGQAAQVPPRPGGVTGFSLRGMGSVSIGSLIWNRIS